MLETRRMLAPVEIKLKELPTMLSAISVTGWRPALWESQKFLLDLAGISDRVQPVAELSRSQFIEGKHSTGDVFFKDDGIYYVLFGPATGHPPNDEEAPENEVEVGIITPIAEGIEDRLANFATIVGRAAGTLRDGKAELDWIAVKPKPRRIAQFAEASEERPDIRFARATLEPEELQASRVLVVKKCRETMIELSQAGFAWERDILETRGKDRDEIRDALRRLKEANLLHSEYLLECRKTSQPLTRFSDPGLLRKQGVGDLVCPSCNALFKDESISEGYSLSELGSKMSRQNYWMTVWVTEQLINLGIDSRAVLWSVSESSEDANLLVDFLGELWLFELKDREFESGDAYRLNYRQVRYRAERTIIVSTARVSADAKRAFEALALQGQPGRRQRRTPVYIESLESVPQLDREIYSASLRFAQERLEQIEDLRKYNVREILIARWEMARRKTLS